jgi:dTDP-4-dehydrorhamnose reductase
MKGEEIKVVDDVVMSPTYTFDLANAVGRIIETRLPYGVYHVVNSGYCTWWEFAKAITAMINSRVEVRKIGSNEYQSKARRPKTSALSNEKLNSYGINMRSWQEGLSDYLRVKGYTHAPSRGLS